MAIDLTASSPTNLTATRWRSLKLYNAYRLVVALLLLAMQDMLNNDAWLQTASTDWLAALALGYFGFSVISTAFTWFEKPNININLPIQILLDIVFIVLMMHAQDGSQSSIGLLLIIAIASASLISEGRLALFYAAIASIGILLEQSYRMLNLETTASSYTPAVLLSLGCFATAWLAYSLAKRAKESELLASQRGLDVQNLAQINALITHEMQDGVLVVGEDFRIKHHNMQAGKLLGLENGYNESTNWQDRSLSEISPEIANLMRLWLEEAEPSHGFVSTNSAAANFLKLTALSRELRLRFLPISEDRTPNSRKQGAVIFIEDWSQMQTQAHQVKLAALGRLTANIAHEIRNPLSAISHANQLLQEDDTDPSTKRMLQIISDNVQRVDQIIKDVLELNRRDRTNQEMLHLENFMQDFYTQFCAVEKIPETAFKLTLINSDTHILFDRRHLNQILWNLCKNGWRHCQKLENSLELALALTGNTKNVQIEINDDGEGIPESVRSHLFEPFFTTEKSGTGLGLYIARELADANGAKLLYKTLDTENETGSLFIMHVKKA
jgi:two-component system, NtrC family, sensor histidine kinase PilS